MTHGFVMKTRGLPKQLNEPGEQTDQSRRVSATPTYHVTILKKDKNLQMVNVRITRFFRSIFGYKAVKEQRSLHSARIEFERGAGAMQENT